jgi:spermidine synthase
VALPAHLKFITAELMSQLPHFPPDMARVETGINRLNNQALVHYFEDEWSR